MIIVTGGAGFIGSNLVRGLNARGFDRILVVDRAETRDAATLDGCRIAGFETATRFTERLRQTGLPDGTTGVLHQGAISDTLATDEERVMRTNYTLPVWLLQRSSERAVPFVYASSASVYGTNTTFREDPTWEAPLNLYARSKQRFDNAVRRHLRSAEAARGQTVAGLRYFNVYGPGESQKGRMASAIYHFLSQAQQDGTIRLFGESPGYAPGEQMRDWVWVEDVVTVNLDLLFGPPRHGIYNVGTGIATSFNQIARHAIAALGTGTIQYIPFPSALRGAYQSYTRADITALRATGYDRPFTPVATGIQRYADTLQTADPLPSPPQPVT